MTDHDDSAIRNGLSACLFDIAEANFCSVGRPIDARAGGSGLRRDGDAADAARIG